MNVRQPPEHNAQPPAALSRRQLLLRVAPATLLLLRPGRALAADPVVQVQAVLFTKALAYDQNLRTRAKSSVHVEVLYRAGVSDSESAAGGVSAAFTTLGKKAMVGGLPLVVTSSPYTSAGALEARLSSLNSTAVFVCPELKDAVPSISAVTRKLAVLSGGGGETYVRAGLSLGFILKDGKPVVIVNLPASRAEGAKLDASLLRLAQVIQ